MTKLPKLFISTFLNEKKKEDKKIMDFLLERNLKINYDDEYDYIEVDFMRYVFDDEENKKVPIGVIIVHGNFCGWSLCNKKDKWNKLFGIYKALCRLGSQKSIDQVGEELFRNVENTSFFNNSKNKRIYLELESILEGRKKINEKRNEK